MPQIVAAELPLAERFVLPRYQRSTILRLHAIEDDQSPSGLRIKLFMEADLDSPMTYTAAIWCQTGEVLPDLPRQYIGTITPGDTELHLYELTAEPVDPDTIRHIEQAMAVSNADTAIGRLADAF